MRIDSSFQPGESYIALTVACRSMAHNFPNTGKEATQHLHLEFETDLIRMRTREGMNVAKANGRLRGKQPKLKPNHGQACARAARPRHLHPSRTR
jgi:hypothetical protein